MRFAIDMLSLKYLCSYFYGFDIFMMFFQSKYTLKRIRTTMPTDIKFKGLFGWKRLPASPFRGGFFFFFKCNYIYKLDQKWQCWFKPAWTKYTSKYTTEQAPFETWKGGTNSQEKGMQAVTGLNWLGCRLMKVLLDSSYGVAARMTVAKISSMCVRQHATASVAVCWRELGLRWWIVQGSTKQCWNDVMGQCRIP